MFRPLINEKLGNLLNLLANKVQTLYLTKALKLLYIIDETSVKEIGVPVTWLEYQVWKYGPVSEEIFNEVRHQLKETYHNQEISLDKFIAIEKVKNPVDPHRDSFILTPKKAFYDGDFTDYEIDLIERVILEYGELSSRDLVRKLHEKGSLWDKTVKSEELQRIFMLQQNRSHHTIDFTNLIKHDMQKQAAYKLAYEAMNFEERLMV